MASIRYPDNGAKKANIVAKQSPTPLGYLQRPLFDITPSGPADRGKSSISADTYAHMLLLRDPQQSKGFNEYLLYSVFFNGVSGDIHRRLLEENEPQYRGREVVAAEYENVPVNLLWNTQEDSFRLRHECSSKVRRWLEDATENFYEGEKSQAFEFKSGGYFYLWIRL